MVEESIEEVIEVEQKKKKILYFSIYFVDVISLNASEEQPFIKKKIAITIPI